MSGAVLGPWHVAFIVIIGGCLAVSTLSNISIIVIVGHHRAMWTLTNLLICNLAFSDFLLAAIVLPQHLHDISHEDEYFESAISCRLLNALSIFCINCSIFSMVAMGVERYRAIVKNLPFKLTFKAGVTVVGVIWFVSLTTMIPTFIEYQKHEQHVNGSNWTVLVCGPGSFPQEFSIFNGFFYLCVSYIIPQLVIYSCYAHVIFFVWIKAKAKEESGEGALASSVVSKGKKRIIIMLLVVAAMFAVSWAPYFVVQTISKVQGTDQSSDASSVGRLLQIVLATLSTNYNVVLYVIFNPAFRVGFRWLFRLRKSEVAPMS